MPGYGDSVTWERVNNPRDPRYDSSAEDGAEAALTHGMETVQYHLDKVQKLIEAGDFKAAQVEFDKIAEVTL